VFYGFLDLLWIKFQLSCCGGLATRAKNRYFLLVVGLPFRLMADISLGGPVLLPERVAKAAQERIDAGTYQTLVFGIVAGDKSQTVVFGKLDDGKSPDGDTVYEVGSITKTFTATLLADAVLSGRFTLDTPVADLLPDFKIPEWNGDKITLGEIGTTRRWGEWAHPRARRVGECHEVHNRIAQG
jgi:Beta-lactamase